MKIAIDLGHGTDKDVGECGIINEEEVINSVGYYLLEELKSKNHEVIEVRPKRDTFSKTLSLKNRVNSSNARTVDIYLSIHTNIGGGTGAEAYTYHGNKIEYATRILNNLDKLEFKNRGIKNGAGLYVIKNTKAKAIVLKLFFIDTLHDVNRYYKVGPKNIAKAIANGLEKTQEDEFVHCNTKDIEYDEDWCIKLKNEIVIQGYAKFHSMQVTNEDILNKAPVIRYGARGNITKLIQERLSINNDGIFGNETRNSVVDFQRENGIKIDGIVGFDTWKCLINLKGCRG